MKREKIFKRAGLMLFASAIYQVYNYLVWMNDSMTDGFSFNVNQIMPILWNCIFFLAPCLMWVLIRSPKPVDKYLYYIAVAAAFIIPICQLLQKFSPNAMLASLPMLILAMPLTIFLSLLCFLNFQINKRKS